MAPDRVVDPWVCLALLTSEMTRMADAQERIADAMEGRHRRMTGAQLLLLRALCSAFDPGEEFTAALVVELADGPQILTRPEIRKALHKLCGPAPMSSVVGKAFGVIANAGWCAGMRLKRTRKEGNTQLWAIDVESGGG